MTIQPTGLLEVQSRISAIQGRFATPAVLRSTSTLQSTTVATATASGGSDFAAALAKLSSTRSDPPASDSGTADGADVVADARKYLGVPYLWGGTDPKKGLDCSGLVQRVYKDLGVDLPRGSRDQAQSGTAVSSLAKAQPGDLVTFGVPANHIGIYIGGNKMIVAPHTGDVVKVQRVYETPSHIRRVLPSSSAGTSTAASTSKLAAPSAASVTKASGAKPSSPAMAAAPAAYRSLFEQAGHRYGVSPDLLAAVAQTESGFRANAVSSAGARGLMQLMPATARGLHVNPMVPAQAVDGAARLLSQHLRSFGSTSLALAAYNAGPGAVTRYHGVPPYPETRSYVTKVLAAAGRSS